MKLLIIVAISFVITTSQACEFAEPIACKNPSLSLHKPSLGQLKKRIQSYNSTLTKHLKKNNQCSKGKEIEYQIKFIEKYAKKNKNQSCEEHVKVLVLQSETLIDSSGDDQKRIKSKKAKLELIDSAVDIAEALVYYKSKHPLF